MTFAALSKESCGSNSSTLASFPSRKSTKIIGQQVQLTVALICCCASIAIIYGFVPWLRSTSLVDATSVAIYFNKFAASYGDSLS